MESTKTQDPTTSVKVTRFISGGVLGFFFGLYLLAKWWIMSYSVAAGILAATICGCGYLALKYGDRFWLDLFDRNR